jgi:hypothetical protein
MKSGQFHVPAEEFAMLNGREAGSIPEAARSLLGREISFANAGNRTTPPKSSNKTWKIVNDNQYIFKDL